MAAKKWKPEYLKIIKKLVRDKGLSNYQISKRLKVTSTTLQNWIRKNPELKRTIRKGKDERKVKQKKKDKKQHILKQLESFPEYVYKRLDPRVQAYWDVINEFDKTQSGVEKTEALLKKGGKYIRQSLFVHAWIVSNFKISFALRKTNIGRTTFEKWKRDPEFLQLIQDIDWYKGNFIEEALMDLIVMRDTSAIIHASKTFNRKRGYNEKLEIEANVTTNENAFDKLPLELKKQIRAELKKQAVEKE